MADYQSGPGENMYLIRVEGQNFKWVIDDTHDLSTIAGGSRLLAKIPELVKATLDACLADGKLKAFETILSAASIGLFVVCPGTATIEEIVAAVKNPLSDPGGDFRHLTVSVEWTATETACLKSEENQFMIPMDALKEIPASLFDRLAAAAHFAQMRAPNVAVPALISDAKKSCCEDHVRPATNNSKQGRSASVNVRRDIGKEFRWRNGTTKKTTESVYTFDQMTGSEILQHDGKIAVISIDGNGFTDIRNKYCQHMAGMQQFSAQLVEKQREFLDFLLAEWTKTETDPKLAPKYFFPYMPSEDDKKIGRKPGNLLRFQRLVTAGDDAVYLMPAWLAWDFLERYFNHTWRLTLPFKDDNGHEMVEEVPLFFRAGVVICSAKAPIHPIRELAGQLEGEIGREAVNAGIENPVAYEILKSFDLIGPRLRDYRMQRAGELKLSDLILDGKKLSDKVTAFQKLDKKYSSAVIKNPRRWTEIEECDDYQISDAYHLSQWKGYLDLEGDRS
jgi:hypothetical protein